MFIDCATTEKIWRTLLSLNQRSTHCRPSFHGRLRSGAGQACQNEPGFHGISKRRHSFSGIVYNTPKLIRQASAVGGLGPSKVLQRVFSSIMPSDETTLLVPKVSSLNWRGKRCKHFSWGCLFWIVYSLLLVTDVGVFIDLSIRHFNVTD